MGVTRTIYNENTVTIFELQILIFYTNDSEEILKREEQVMMLGIWTQENL